MGRGQQTVTKGWVADHFSAVFGNRRGTNRIDETPPYTSANLELGAYVLVADAPGQGEALSLNDPSNACVAMYRKEPYHLLAHLEFSTLRSGVSFQLKQKGTSGRIAGCAISRDELLSVIEWLASLKEIHPDW